MGSDDKNNASTQQRADDLQKNVMALWRRYRELTAAVLSLQADIADLRNAKDEIGKQIYELYRANDRCLDCPELEDRRQDTEHPAESGQQ